MKKTLIILAAITLIASCTKISDPNEITVDPATTSRLTTVEKFQVPVKTGYTTIVKLGSDTLCSTTEATSIWVPKQYAATKADEGVTVSYFEGTDPNAGSSQMWQTVGFEDSEMNDYDYNDIVIHVKYQLKDGNFGIGVHPIALGSTKQIGLGCKIFINDKLVKNEYICDNCRKTLFDGQSGFINTQRSGANFHTNFFKAAVFIDKCGTTKLSDISVVWYIVVDSGTIFYAVNNHYGYLNKDNVPYGILITDTGKLYDDHFVEDCGYNWFCFPYENVSMFDTYNHTPSFEDWIKGNSDYCDFDWQPNNAIDPNTYTFYRSDEGETIIYKFPSGRTPWNGLR